MSSRQSLFDQNITVENSSITLFDNSASGCSVETVNYGEDSVVLSTSVSGGAFGVHIGAISHSTSSAVLSSFISGSLISRNFSFIFEKNNISSCFAVVNVTGRTDVAAATGGALSFQMGFVSSSQVQRCVLVRVLSHAGAGRQHVSVKR
jgi:hypothetical protein